MRNTLFGRAFETLTSLSAAEKATQASVAIVVFAYNEHFFFPIWRRYYESQVPGEHIYVFDHGSDQDFAAGLDGLNHIRMPRDSYDPGQVSRFLTFTHRALLEFYDYVIIVDADEFIVADPKKYDGLVDFCTRANPEHCSPIGLTVPHIDGLQDALDVNRPVLEQRPYAFFVPHMCKPTVSRVPIVFTAATHRSDRPPVIQDDLFLLHLKYVDKAYAEERLRYYREELAWSQESLQQDIGGHVRENDDALQSRFTGFRKHLEKGVKPFRFKKEIERYLREYEPAQGDYVPPVKFFRGPMVKFPARFHGLI